MGYLQRLGVTALWISPVFKQVSFDEGSYHGYGIQNFLDVDPHWGSREDLREMVKTAHEHRGGSHPAIRTKKSSYSD